MIRPHFVAGHDEFLLSREVFKLKCGEISTSYRVSESNFSIKTSKVEENLFLFGKRCGEQFN